MRALDGQDVQAAFSCGCGIRQSRITALFRNFAVAAACSSTRAALYTGRDHLLTGVWGVPPRANLQPDEARMPAFFKAAGYSTLHVGKLDCVKAAGKTIEAFGWDDYLGGGGYQTRNLVGDAAFAEVQAACQRQLDGWLERVEYSQMPPELRSKVLSMSLPDRIAWQNIEAVQFSKAQKGGGGLEGE